MDFLIHTYVSKIYKHEVVGDNETQIQVSKKIKTIT